MRGSSKTAARPKTELVVTSEGNIIRTQLWRTQQCKFFLKGKCSRGSGCSFAHGNVNLAPDFTKTSLCEAFCSGKGCRLSSVDCPFAHGVKELRMTHLFMTKKAEDVSAGQSGDFVLPPEPPPPSSADTINFLNMIENQKRQPSTFLSPPGLDVWNAMQCHTNAVPYSQYNELPYSRKMPWPEVPPSPIASNLPLPSTLLVADRSSGPSDQTTPRSEHSNTEHGKGQSKGQGKGQSKEQGREQRKGHSRAQSEEFAKEQCHTEKTSRKVALEERLSQLQAVVKETAAESERLSQCHAGDEQTMAECELTKQMIEIILAKSKLTQHMAELFLSESKKALAGDLQ